MRLKITKTDFSNEYLQHSDRYLPMIDHAWQIFPQRSEYGEVNIGWDAGLIAEKRPYFCECWAEGYTVLTYFISTKGIEDYTPEQLENLLRESGIIWYKEPGIRHPDVQIFSDNSGQDFFSVNYLVGDDDGSHGSQSTGAGSYEPPLPHIGQEDVVEDNIIDECHDYR